MAQMTLPQAIETGLSHHRAGRFKMAQDLYEQVLKFEPQNVDALHLLGVLSHQAGSNQRAIELIARAVELNPDVAVMHYNLSEAQRAQGLNADALASLGRAVELAPEYMEAHNNLSLVLNALGQHEEAAAAARRAIDLDPTSPSPHNNLSNALRHLDRIEEAIESALQALHLRSEFPEALNNLGICYAKQNRIGEAVASYRHAIKLKPDFAEAMSNLGGALGRAGKHDEAVEALQQAIRIRPDYPDAYNNLGGALKSTGQMDQGVLCYEKAVALKPAFPEALNNLGLTLKELGRYDQALSHIRRAIEIKPDFADAHHNLGLTLKDQTKLDECAEALQKSIRLSGARGHFGATSALAIVRMEQGLLDESMKLMRAALATEKDWQVHSNLCLLANYHPGLSGEQVLEIHRDWDRDYGAGAIAAAKPGSTMYGNPHENDRTPGRKLRVGYVSPDFKSHAVSHFIEPVLASHDTEKIEIYCYAHVAKPDPVTHILRTRAHGWREIYAKRDDVVERMIRDDKIDILVDLAGHTGHNRLTLFARKPAPVQVTMIGYPATTGLSAMDYKIADPHSDPEGAERFYSEKLVRLDGTFWCFRPLDDREPIGDLPVSRNGFVTFGSVNNVAKITPAVLDLWARIVAAVPKARIHMQHSALGSESARQRFLDVFARHGVSEDRVKLTGWAGFSEYVDLLRTFDVALDPFPFNGGTTTCHLFFYGVPIVALAGERQVSRMGVSMLRAIGLPELIAESADAYFEKSVALAQDIPRMTELRSSIRSRMIQSPLCDAIGYTRKLETAYREMWSTWCSSQA